MRYKITVFCVAIIIALTCFYIYKIHGFISTDFPDDALSESEKHCLLLMEEVWKERGDASIEESIGKETVKKSCCIAVVPIIEFYDDFICTLPASQQDLVRDLILKTELEDLLKETPSTFRKEQIPDKENRVPTSSALTLQERLSRVLDAEAMERFRVYISREQRALRSTQEAIVILFEHIDPDATLITPEIRREILKKIEGIHRDLSEQYTHEKKEGRLFALEESLKSYQCVLEVLSLNINREEYEKIAPIFEGAIKESEKLIQEASSKK